MNEFAGAAASQAELLQNNQPPIAKSVYAEIYFVFLLKSCLYLPKCKE